MIIGGDSYIASSFYLLKKDKYDFIIFSRVSTGKRNEYIVSDFCEIESQFFSKSDIVINFAAIVHRSDIADESLYNLINYKLPVFLAEESKNEGVSQFIQMSTIAVYGDANFIDHMTPERPINYYGKSKLLADKELLSIKKNNFYVSCIRPPMVYGGVNTPGNMMSLTNAALKGIPMPFKNTSNKRDFINVFNLVDCIDSVIQNKINGIVIPTDRNPVSTRRIIEIVKEESGKKILLFSLPKFIHFLVKRIFPSKYNKVFGSLLVECNIGEEYYNPKYNLRDGLKSMIEVLEKK